MLEQRRAERVIHVVRINPGTIEIIQLQIAESAVEHGPAKMHRNRIGSATLT